MADSGSKKLPFYKYDDKGKDFRILLTIDELKTKLVSKKPVDGVTVHDPKFTDRSVMVKVTIDQTKKSEEIIYLFSLKLPETIIPGESRLKILGDQKIELRLRKEEDKSWETYNSTMEPSLEMS